MYKSSENNPQPASEIILYQTEDGRNRIEVRLEHETVWLTIQQMAELFQVDKSGISRHLKSIYETGELRREATVAKYATVQKEGAWSVARDRASRREAVHRRPEDRRATLEAGRESPPSKRKGGKS